MVVGQASRNELGGSIALWEIVAWDSQLDRDAFWEEHVNLDR
jgi:hypothetical protein